MTDPIVLTEYQDWCGELCDADISFVAGQLSRYLSSRLELREGKILSILNPGQFVGVAMLPSGRRIECRPKVPIASVLYMLSVAYDVPHLLPEHTEIASLTDLLQLVVRYFAGLVTDRIARGLYRAYREVEENLPVVRGRIDIAQDLRQNYVLRHRVFCRFTEFTWDISQNQILRQVIRMLAGWSFPSDLTRQLAELGARLMDLTPTNFRPHDLDAFHYGRFNDDYRPIHALCRLFLQAASLSEQAGAYDFPAFLIDMNHLFETFITRVLQRGIPPSVAIRGQETAHLDGENQVQVRADLVFSRSGQTILIADCKYKRAAPGSYQNHDLYQLLAYCMRWQVTRGALIYPQHIENAEGVLHIRNTGVAIRRFSLDLGQEPAAIDGDCEQLRSALLCWADTP